jgi:hypothetical protein
MLQLLDVLDVKLLDVLDDLLEVPNDPSEVLHDFLVVLDE